MRDNGFLEEKGPGTVRDILGKKPRTLVTAKKGEQVGQVIEDMKRHGISQMPVLTPDGTALGMIHEYDLLDGLVQGRVKKGDVIDGLVAPLDGVVTMETTLPQLRAVFAQDNVAVVREGQRIVAVVTRVDLIEYLAG
jgi:cystathionine beta-synthase